MQKTDSRSSEGYWHETRRPLACLLFLLPLLAVYEAGVLWLGGTGAQLLRNGADNWMRWALIRLGFGQLYVLPILILGYFLVWQVWAGHPWRVSTPTLAGMLAESALFAIGLLALSHLQQMVYEGWVVKPVAYPALGDHQFTLMLLVAYIGAGVYEEVLFRLGMLPACYGLLRLMSLSRAHAIVGAVVVTSLLFSAAHYVGPYADTFDVFSGLFRFLAGVVFASLFVLRGFGIAVGAHALYDIVVGVLT